MKKLATTLFLFSIALLATAGNASANPPINAQDIRRLLGGGPTIPDEWAGIWSVTDTLYNCPNSFLSTSTGLDTLCIGMEFEPPEQDPSFTFDCTGTITATTINQTCTGTGDFSGCTVNFVITIVGTHSPTSYDRTTTINATYSGPPPCDTYPPQCFIINSHGTLADPKPESYCDTPAEPMTWGKVKGIYR